MSQVLHVGAAARGASPELDVCVESGMMVLLVRHVHLQNNGGARPVRLLVLVGGMKWETHRLLKSIL